MIDICYKKRSIRIVQSWFYQELASKMKGDIYLYHGIPLDYPLPKNTKSEEFHTIITNLTEEKETLWNHIHKNIKYEINRNKNKDEVVFKSFTSKEIEEDHKITDTLAEIYNVMYQSKGLNNTFNDKSFVEYVKGDAVVMTGIYLEDDPIILHVYLVDKNQVRLLYSVSNFRSESMDSNKIGRSNKRLHWEDYILFKELGIEFYDWGGISDIENPNGIDAFKLKFGGEITTYQNVYVGKTILGRLGLWIK